MIKKCAYCSKDFTPRNLNRKYCSEECSKRAERDKEKFAKAHPHLPKLCPTCGVQFTPHHNHQKYCSVACRPKKIYIRKVRTVVKKPAPQPVSKTCPICGQPFETFSNKRKYCSAQCSHQADIILKRKSRAKYRANSRRSSQPRTLSEYEKRSLQFTGSILSDNKTLKTPPILLTVKPTPTPIPIPPKREIIIPAAVAENRQPTVNELLDWVFQNDKQ